MKIQKRVDQTKGVDQYIIYIEHAEANAAFEVMSPLEKGMIHDLQRSDHIASIIKALSIWATRIEQVSGIAGKPRRAEKGQCERP